MTEYKIIWEIHVEADTPQDAANESRRTQLDYANMAWTFTVIDVDTKESVQIDAEAHEAGRQQ
jgi:hypothetical protein